MHLTSLTLFKALADETRLKSLLMIVKEGEMCVCELMCALNESQPKISRHLALLKKQNLLIDRKHKQWVYYQINPELPEWMLELLKQTERNSTELLIQPFTQLAQMGDRPERQITCCE